MNDDITASIEKDILERIQVIVTRRQTTVSDLVRKYLVELAAKDEAQTEACQRLKARMKNPPLRVGESRWTREELHGR
jgi:hypothetical protein